MMRTPIVPSNSVSAIVGSAGLQRRVVGGVQAKLGLAEPWFPSDLVDDLLALLQQSQVGSGVVLPGLAHAARDAEPARGLFVDPPGLTPGWTGGALFRRRRHGPGQPCLFRATTSSRRC